MHSAEKPVTENSVDVCRVSRGAAEALERRVIAASATDFMVTKDWMAIGGFSDADWL
jgi:hypothetical protein